METVQVKQVLHPLEPLLATEILEAVSILKKIQNLGEKDRFVSVSLQEPKKQDVLTFKEGNLFQRKAFIIILNSKDEKTYEAVVCITEGTVDSWTHIPGVQPTILLEEFGICEAIVKECPEFQEALKKRNIVDLDKVGVDPLTAGNFGHEDEDGLRLIRALAYVKNFPGDNRYARPIQGVVVMVDINKGKVVRVEDHGIIPLPPLDGNYTPDAVGNMRSDIKPLEIIQSEGPSFQIEGHKITWQKWNIRFGFNPREGLVLNTVSYEDKGVLRDVLYRASLSEMVVPYGDPCPTRSRMNAFDCGEYGIGILANSLELGCDCLGEIKYFDANMADSEGNVIVIPNAVCLHEEDTGILWKHTDLETNTVEVRRSRRLVLSSISTVGNYDYGFYWYFNQDGSIEFEVKATGIVNTVAVLPDTNPKYGTLVAPQLSGVIHQHFFGMRLDMQIDGQNNSIYEVDTHSEPMGESNPYGNAFYDEATQLKTESEAQRRNNINTARFWKIVNPSIKNIVGEPVGYKLDSIAATVPFAHPESSIMKRAGFMKNHLWVTPYEEKEKYAAGDYPNQHAGGDGVATWTEQNRSLDNTDLVIWPTLGMHHVVRLEDWPIMPVAKLGFSLKPFGFFDANPSLDVPPSEPKKGATCH